MEHEWTPLKEDWDEVLVIQLKARLRALAELTEHYIQGHYCPPKGEKCDTAKSLDDLIQQLRSEGLVE